MKNSNWGCLISDSSHYYHVREKQKSLSSSDITKCVNVFIY